MSDQRARSIDGLTYQGSPYLDCAAQPTIDAKGLPVGAIIGFPMTGSTSKSTAGGPAPDQTQLVLTSRYSNPTTSDVALYTVPAGKTFFLTDFVVTGNPASGNPLVVLKANNVISSGSITLNASPQAVSITSLALSASYGNQIYVGQFVDIETPNAANYEVVQVTAVATNANGIVTGFSAIFTKNHVANSVVGVPLEVALINATKGIEEVGIETQPSAPGGSVLALNVGAFTGTLCYNIRGFVQ